MPDERGPRAWRRALAASPRGRFYVACGVGGVAAMVLFAWFALDGRFNLFGNQALANFYEVQARSWLHGHWDAAPGAYVFERFNVHGRFYTYFGPWPALLRLPVVLFTSRYDGDLSRVSMILAFGVTLVYSARLAWQTRRLVVGDEAPTRATLWMAGGFTFVAGCASPALFLASDTWVYHEAILWGLAWAIASFSYLLEYLVTPSRRSLVLACVTATFAYLSRGSVGLGPVGALALVLLARAGAWLWRRVRAWRAERPEAPAPWLRWLGLGGADANRRVGPIALATAVPLALYAYVNEVKFHTLFGTPPYQLQDLLAGRPNRRAALAANHGSLFGFKYAPTIFVAYARPDAIRFDRLFPWVSFAGPPRVFGHVVFEAINYSASIPATSTILCILAVAGVVAALRPLRRDPDSPSAAALRVPLLGAALGCVGTFYLAFLEERYLGDLVPFLVVAGAAGLWYLVAQLSRSRAAVRWLTGGVLVAVAAWSCWVTFGLTLLQQRDFGPLVSTETRARFINFQLGVHETIPGGAPSGVLRQAGLPLPPPARANTLLVVGDCAGLYWSDGRFWHPVEETAETGTFDARITFASAPANTLVPVLSATDSHGSSILWARVLGPNRLRFEYDWTGPNQSVIEGATPDVAQIGQRTSAPLTVPFGQSQPFTLRLDPAGYVGVADHGRLVVSTFAPVAASPASVGVQRVSTRGATRFPGSIEVSPTPTPICRRLLANRR